jgi:3-deoxy-manno-octulosonate cytidylyltransferase (CMP-KDO synthetase)
MQKRNKKDIGTLMNIVGIIPARMGSTRFPGKPLAKIHGIPMIGHVYGQCKKSKILDDVYIATCDKEIVNYIDSIGATAIMTSNNHERASERVAESIEKIEIQRKENIDIVLMIQGDEPLVNTKMIDKAVLPLLENQSVSVVNIMQKILTDDDFEDRNTVKVVVDSKNFALYFSREAIPSRKMYPKEIQAFKQTGLIAFRRERLIEFSNIKPSKLEEIESVDMNRFLENGFKIKMVLDNSPTLGIDVPEHIKFVEENFKIEMDYNFIKIASRNIQKREK